MLFLHYKVPEIKQADRIGIINVTGKTDIEADLVDMCRFWNAGVHVTVFRTADLQRQPQKQKVAVMLVVHARGFELDRRVFEAVRAGCAAANLVVLYDIEKQRIFRVMHRNAFSFLFLYALLSCLLMCLKKMPRFIRRHFLGG